MKIHNSFHVSKPPDEVWQLLIDIERMAPCLPGAELLETKPDNSYVGRVSIRLGPVALSFKGNAVFEDRDDEARTARVKASGNEERARGTARATTAFTAKPANEGGTTVSVDTDLTLAGSIAQYARGASMIETTAQVLIDDFAKNLEELLAQGDASATSSCANALDTAPRPVSSSASEPAPARPAAISGLALFWRVILRWLFPSKAGSK